MYQVFHKSVFPGSFQNVKWRQLYSYVNIKFCTVLWLFHKFKSFYLQQGFTRQVCYSLFIFTHA